MPHLCSIALPVPLPTLFDYSYHRPLAAGVRVHVQFGRGRGRSLIGIVIGSIECAELGEGIKPIAEVIDPKPLLPVQLLALCQWAADYYHHPFGETLFTALPKKLRDGQPGQLEPIEHWQLTPQGKGLGPNALARAKRQQEALNALQTTGPVTSAWLKNRGIQTQSLKQLQAKGLVELVHEPEQPIAPTIHSAPYPLNPGQQDCLEQLSLDGFSISLLEGSTGSGKTEVYLQLISAVLARGQQALVLIPEIGLSPQTMARFHERFDARIVALNSGQNDTQRARSWLEANAGLADIVIGTRSAVFVPSPRLGVIIIDEEHDQSFKQQDGLRYSARDLAAVRAKQTDIPLVLGTATPALETLHNARTGRYRNCRLHARAGSAKPPSIELMDIRREPLAEGLSEAALEQARSTLARGEQCLVFVNRRGFAPSITCHDCGWRALCPNCDSHLTLHQSPHHLRCHHCDYQRRPDPHCPECLSSNIVHRGAGTEKIEQLLVARLAPYPVIRVDRDNTRRKQAMEQLLAPVNAGEACVLVGTQMLAKGHHFPNITLVLVVDADGGLFAADFRAAERTGQLLLQVAGRSGRGDRPGRVVIQTHHPDHPLYADLFTAGYNQFAQRLANERELAQMPPFSYLAVIRAEAADVAVAEQFLQGLKLPLRAAIEDVSHDSLAQVMGPLPAIIERVNRRFRLFLQIKCEQRALLHHLLEVATQAAYSQRLPKGLRWSLDIDPIEMP